MYISLTYKCIHLYKRINFYICVNKCIRMNKQLLNRSTKSHIFYLMHLLKEKAAI